MLTKYVGSGGLGDSVILSAKLLNILSKTHSAQDAIMYHHLESNKRQNYENPLNEYWKLVQAAAERYVKCFIFKITMYQHSKFWEVVPREVFNLTTGLTTKVDRLCSPPPPEIVRQDPRFYKSITVVADGGGGSRGFTTKAIKQLNHAFPNQEIVTLGCKYKELPEDIYNLTDQTTLKDALKIVRSSKMVIGPDGILTYFASIYGVPTLTIFHETPLVNSYNTHCLPQSKGSILIHGGQINDATAVAHLAQEIMC